MCVRALKGQFCISVTGADWGDVCDHVLSIHVVVLTIGALVKVEAT